MSNPEALFVFDFCSKDKISKNIKPAKKTKKITPKESSPEVVYVGFPNTQTFFFSSAEKNGEEKNTEEDENPKPRTSQKPRRDLERGGVGLTHPPTQNSPKIARNP